MTRDSQLSQRLQLLPRGGLDCCLRRLQVAWWSGRYIVDTGGAGDVPSEPNTPSIGDAGQRRARARVRGRDPSRAERLARSRSSTGRAPRQAGGGPDAGQCTSERIDHGAAVRLVGLDHRERGCRCECPSVRRAQLGDLHERRMFDGGCARPRRAGVTVRRELRRRSASSPWPADDTVDDCVFDRRGSRRPSRRPRGTPALPRSSRARPSAGAPRRRWMPAIRFLARHPLTPLPRTRRRVGRGRRPHHRPGAGAANPVTGSRAGGLRCGQAARRPFGSPR